MVINKKKLASMLILIVFLIIYLYISFNDISFINVDLSVFLTFILNAIISIFFVLTEKENFTLSKTFYYFNFFFLVIAPMFQFLTNCQLWNYHISNNTYLISNLFIMLWLIIYKLFYTFFWNKYNKVKQPKISEKTISYTLLNLIILNILSVFCFAFTVSRVSFGGLFMRNVNNISFDSGAILTIVGSLCRSIPVYTVLYAYFYCKKYKKSYFHLIIPVTFTILLNFPASVARYWLGIVYIGLILIFVKKYIVNKRFDLFLIILFAVLFPIFQLFKWYGVEVLNDSSLILSKFSSTYNNADFDAYSMFGRSIDYVRDSGHTFGHQILASLFFWIPRSLWTAKPYPSGQFIADAQNQYFTNLSFPLIGEGYLDFGIIGIIAFCVFISYISSRLDFMYWYQNDESKIINFIYPFSFGAFIFLQRGSMQPVIVFTFAFYLFLIVLSKCILKNKVNGVIQK